MGRAPRLIIESVAAVLLFIADLLIKSWVKRVVPTRGDIVLFRNILSLRFVKNTGAAWGLFNDNTVLLSVVVGAVLIAMAVYLVIDKDPMPLKQGCLVLIFSGGAANLVDRLLNGFVTDYISCDFINFPVFNFADCLIVVGCIVLILYLLWDTVRDARRKKAASADG